MVIRVATVWILIATLILCPFACLAESVAAIAAPEVRHGCGVADRCCALPCCSTDERDPGDRERGGRGGDCLCRGAVITDHASASELLPVPVFWGLQAPPASTACALSTVDGPADKHGCHFANADSGREVRALIESFLL
ncbi:MAG: hypothetical protein A2W31_13380 [Planctomycetes bacterium RBG_16_64_10]|nr:MAG: hypothetical protein A2W31_13380 [Planctomycetes bacterium RBG_16_64_10]